MPDSREKFTLKEFIENFDLGRVDPAGPVFDLRKLDWLNGEWIRTLSVEELTTRLKDYADVDKSEIKRILPLVQDRLKKLSDFNELTSYFYQAEVDIDPVQIILKGQNADDTKKVLKTLEDTLSNLKTWNRESIEKVLEKKPEELGWSKTDLFQTLRYVETGSKATPPLFDVLEAIGKKITIVRLQKAIHRLN